MRDPAIQKEPNLMKSVEKAKQFYNADTYTHAFVKRFSLCAQMFKSSLLVQKRRRFYRFKLKLKFEINTRSVARLKLRSKVIGTFGLIGTPMYLSGMYPEQMKQLCGYLPVVNFTNILQAAFYANSLLTKNTNTNCKCRKAAIDTFIQKSARKMLTPGIQKKMICESVL